MKYEYQLQAREEGQDWFICDGIFESLFSVRETMDWFMKTDKKLNKKRDYRIMCRIVPRWDFLEEYDYEEEE